MRKIVMTVAAILGCSAPAAAQVTVDLNALDALPRSSAPAIPRPASRQPPRPNMTLAPASPVVPPRGAVPIGVPTAMPPPVAEQAAPVRATVAPLPVPDPPPIPKPAMASLRIPFSGEQAELSPDGAAAIKGLVASAPITEMVSFNVVAYATGAQDDPSTARRLSLSRALAARGALLGNGVASSRIFVRALGSQSGDGPPDRVDISILGGNAPPSRP